MTDILPITSAELADLKAKAKAARVPRPHQIVLRDFSGTANPETILRLLDMIERRDEQIEKLRGALRTARGYVEKTYGVLAAHTSDDTRNLVKPDLDIIDEALAATEPHDE